MAALKDTDEGSKMLADQLMGLKDIWLVDNLTTDMTDIGGVFTLCFATFYVAMDSHTMTQVCPKEVERE